MSREIRRVPVDWQHPIEPNPHWEFQIGIRLRQGKPLPKLHKPEERFVSLLEGPYSEALAEWEQDCEQWRNGTHRSLTWLLSYHSADGWVDRQEVRHEPNPFRVYAEDGNTVIREFFPEDVKQIMEVESAEDHFGEAPNSAHYMPDFDVPVEELGWCLYQTVSEGTPVTPVFATAEELIEHLSTVGQDCDQEPMRREAAEALVRTGFSIGSSVSSASGLVRSDLNADELTPLED